MDLEVISFLLAFVLGVLCFGLVKYATDEFDSWFDERVPARRRFPAILGIITTSGLMALFIFTR